VIAGYTTVERAVLAASTLQHQVNNQAVYLPSRRLKMLQIGVIEQALRVHVRSKLDQGFPLSVLEQNIEDKWMK